MCQEQDKCVLWVDLWDVHLIFQGHFLRWHEAYPGAFTTPTTMIKTKSNLFFWFWPYQYTKNLLTFFSVPSSSIKDSLV